MRIDPDGRRVSVRGRQVHMSRADVVDFLRAVATGFPEVRFFDTGLLRQEARMPEISRGTPVLPDRDFVEVDMLFVGPEWQPEFTPGPPYNVPNYPQLNAFIRPARFNETARRYPETDRLIMRSDHGMLNANHFADGPDGREGKRVIDKLFRLHRKTVDNHVVPVDLRTGAVAGPEEASYDWHGPDQARQCLTRKDHYLGISILPNRDRFWGYLPARLGRD